MYIRNVKKITVVTISATPRLIKEMAYILRYDLIIIFVVVVLVLVVVVMFHLVTIVTIIVISAVIVISVLMRRGR